MLREAKAEGSDDGGGGLEVNKFGWLRHPNLLTPKIPQVWLLATFTFLAVACKDSMIVQIRLQDVASILELLQL
eukprot:gene26132-biopygen14243